ncbi:MAG: hypothetical protein JWN69_2112 [Alphaproteobacteria bacterium]|nr:hypothetical protein [Alphaproteobacteria bacterium]
MWSGLSLLAAAAVAAAPAGTTPLVLLVSINGTPAGAPMIVQRDAQGRFHLPAAALAERRVETEGAPLEQIEDETYISQDGLGAIAAVYDETGQQLDLSLPAAKLDRTKLSYGSSDPGPMTPAGTGFLLNYDVIGEVVQNHASLNGGFELGFFSGASFVQTNAIASWSQRGARFRRLDSSWTADDPDGMRSLRVGDAISRGGVGGGPLHFGGIQLSRNFAVQPGYVTLPTPSLSGSAALPSVIELYVNDALVGSRTIAPGPFTIQDTPIVTGGGEVQLVVRDTLGRQNVITQKYYAAPSLLRAGLHDYSYEIGFLRRDYGRSSFSYGEFIASATHRVGLTDTVTVEAHAEAGASVQLAGIAADLSLRGVGLVGVSAATSRSSSGGGATVAAHFERRTPWLSLSASAEFASAGYRQPDSYGPPPALTAQASLGLPTSFGSIGASYLRYKARGDDPNAEFLGANASVRLGRLGSMRLAARQSFRTIHETQLELSLIAPLGGRTSASLGVRQDNAGSLVTAALQRNAASDQGWSYAVSGTAGRYERLDGRLNVQGSLGEYGAELSYVDNKLGARVSIAGGIGSVGGEVFASRRLSQGFATVQVGSYENVRVYVDNRLVGRTNKKGRAIVPRLRPYEKNMIRIELADLPLDTNVTGGERMIRPYARAGVPVDFQARQSRGALLRVRLANDQMIPAGATLRVGGADFIAAPGGEVFLAGLSTSKVVEASWPGGRCRFTLDVPPSTDPQPDLGVQVCAAVGQGVSQWGSRQ